MEETQTPELNPNGTSSFVNRYKYVIIFAITALIIIIALILAYRFSLN